MKRFILALLTFSTAGILSAQQTPLYILFNSSCMDQLEYRYIYAGNSVTAYSIHPSANENYILTVGSGGINSPTLPKNTVNCREYALNEQFLNDINSVSRQVYIVQQLTQGYMLTPVISATQILRSGNYYLLRAPNYSFAVDTSNLVYESNIATGSSNWYIYFNGLKIRGCYYEYSFKREPTKTGQEHSEFDLIPGIGMTSERTGMTASDAEANHLRLIRINGQALEDYIATRCQSATAPNTPGTQPLSQYTPQVNYGTTPVGEKDKELSSISNSGSKPAATTGAMPPQLANCPEPPGDGYHIVQPGETLHAIARAYTVSVKSLISWNGLKDPDKITVCQKIWLRKPPVTTVKNLSSTSKGGGEQNPATYSTTGQGIRQDAYWQNNATTPLPSQYNYQQPAQYNYQPQPPAQITYAQPPAATAQPYVPPTQTLVHVVQKGETLYGIGSRYGITESEMRRLNKFPAVGEVVVKPGMQLFVADCCPATTTPAASSAITPTPSTTYPTLGTQPQYNTAQPQYNTAQPQYNTAQPQYNTTQPQYNTAQPQYNTTQPQYNTTQPAVNYNALPDLFNTPTTTQPTSTAPATYNYQPPAATNNPATGQITTPAVNQTAKQPAYFQEYIVREGDTINSIAIKFKVNAQELALVNNKEPNETLIAGQRLLIPRN